MPSTYTDNGGIELIGLGEKAGAWGTTTNNNFSIIDRLTNGVKVLTITGDTTLTTSDGSLSDGMFKLIHFKGTVSASSATITINPQDAQKVYFIQNDTTKDLVFQQGGTSDTATVKTADSGIIFADGGSGSAVVLNLADSFTGQGLRTTGSDDITLDAAGGDFKFSVSDTEILRISNSSSDVIIKPIADEKDIIFQQRDGTEVARIEDNGTFNVVTDKLAINATAVTSTAEELNLLDGGTSVGSSITIADTDGVVVNDGGTMKSVPASDFRTYIMPAGSVIPFAGSSAPTGFLLCHGQAVSRTTYATLFAALSTTYGSGDGSSTFNLPDLRGRVVAGLDNMGGSSADRLTNQSGGINGDALNATGGSETHTLTVAQIPSHSHTVTAHENPGGSGDSNGSEGGESSFDRTSTTTSTGGGGTHNNVQPTIILNYIIRT